MTTLQIAGAGGRSVERSPRREFAVRRVLLLSGVLSSLLYATMLAVVPVQWEGYSSASQVPSELSAIGAPTRALWVWLGALYALLYAAGAAGVWRSVSGRRALRVAAGLMLAQVLVGAFWPPMHLRGAEPTLTDTLHVAFAAAWLLLMLLIMGSGAAALGRRFRLYSIATVVVFLVFGTLTSLEAPRVAANLPTPLIGVWERINIGAALLWIAVFCIALWPRGDDGSR